MKPKLVSFNTTYNFEFEIEHEDGKGQLFTAKHDSKTDSINPVTFQDGLSDEIKKHAYFEIIKQVESILALPKILIIVRQGIVQKIVSSKNINCVVVDFDDNDPLKSTKLFGKKEVFFDEHPERQLQYGTETFDLKTIVSNLLNNCFVP